MNKFKLMLKINALLGLTTLSFLTYSNPSSASAFPAEGTYRGMIKTKTGDEIPLRFDLSYSDVLTPAPDDDLFPMKRAITASLIVDNDGGPYSLGQVNFNLETGKFELLYTRPNTISPSLKFQGNLVTDTRIKGHVVSGPRGDLGTFDVTKDSKVGVKAHSIYTGQYVGTITYSAGGDTFPLRIRLDPNTLTSTNPPDFEFDFTPGYAGGAVLNAWEAVIQTVAIDYFTHTVFLTHHEITGATFTLTGKVTPEGITGYMSSSLKGHTADFTVKRITR